jgi:hypothetical protein
VPSKLLRARLSAHPARDGKVEADRRRAQFEGGPIE